MTEDDYKVNLNTLSTDFEHDFFPKNDTLSILMANEKHSEAESRFETLGKLNVLMIVINNASSKANSLPDWKDLEKSCSQSIE